MKINGRKRVIGNYSIDYIILQRTKLIVIKISRSLLYLSYQANPKNQQPSEPTLEFYKTFNLRTIDLSLLIFAIGKRTLLFKDWGWPWINIHRVIVLDISPLFRFLGAFCFLLPGFSFEYIKICSELLRRLPFNSNGSWLLE